MNGLPSLSELLPWFPLAAWGLALLAAWVGFVADISAVARAAAWLLFALGWLAFAIWTVPASGIAW